MRLLFVARAMNGMAGGLERMIVTIMNEMVRRGHEVALLSWDREDAEAFYPITSEIHWYKLHTGDASRKANVLTRLQRVPKIRRSVSHFSPNVIICFQGGPFRAMLSYTAGMGIPLIAAERTAPTLYEHANNEWSKRKEHFSFRFAKQITVQFDRYRDYYPKALQKLIVETPNPVSEAIEFSVTGAANQQGRFTLLSVGRLSFQKNYQALIRAFSLLADRFLDWDLKIVGEGEDRASLQEIINASPNLRGRVFLTGTTSDVASAYVSSNLFCLPSRWEGFPNALAEALAHGLPSVGYADCAGVYDLIEHGETGLLADGNGSPDSLSKALGELMIDHDRRTEMGSRARLSMRQYLPSACLDRWENVLKHAAN
ncbi:glycosyltransferase family 4 protein [Rhizobium laguerreae]|uniref:glycosyltransferase n=1 Tax=Rhizobium laguerreae TaxID=1076926 RepID=UPI001C910DD4|nr:glycosyltransferase [Rhizobium laguerreae]MBY3237822.1 glycosyltransferase family 4 protein [Rhizobium laguerreae]